MMLADLAPGVSVVTGVTCYHLHFRRGNFLAGSVENSEADRHLFHVIVLEHRFGKGCRGNEKIRALRAPRIRIASDPQKTRDHGALIATIFPGGDMPRIGIWTLAALVPLAAFAQETILLRDGTSFDGRMTAATEKSITFRDNSGQMHRFDVDRVQSIQFSGPNGAGSHGSNYPGNNSAGAAALPPADNQRQAYPGSAGARAGRNAIEVPAGTEIAVRTNESIDARDTSQGTSYAAQVDRDVVDTAGNVIIPRGSEARLVVRRADNSTLALDLQSIRVNGRTYKVDTSDNQQTGAREGLGANRRTGEFVGGGAALGTLLGAIAGGGKGAAIGALAGAGAGAGTQVLTRGDRVRVPAESVLSFRLDSPLRMRAA
jgi:hypothetical protein